MNPQILLICTVGGTCEPVVQSILHTNPARILFIHSADTRQTCHNALEELASYERPVAEGMVDYLCLTDPQSLHKCVTQLRDLGGSVTQWCQRSDRHQVFVDFTGGTKMMSAALALVAHRWPCRFSYVGGTRRDKNGVGVVVSGAEKVLVSENPWDAMAFQPMQDAIHLFNHHHPAAAVHILEPYGQRPDLDTAIKRRLTAIKHLAQAYAHWDGFQHQTAVRSFQDCLRAANDLDAAIPGHTLNPILNRHKDLCDKLSEANQAPNQELILDLLANAQRRAQDHRFDDAVARLYRATEALAQLALKQDHQIDTASCALERLPIPLQKQWASRSINGNIKLALQDAYTLLAALKHRLGISFRELDLHEKTSPLVGRNQSILAHGFTPMTRKAYESLWNPVWKLAGQPDLSEYQFPSLPNT